MLKSLKEFFLVSVETVESGSQHTLELAAAVLMVEISRADSSIGDEERDVIDRSLLQHFHLSPEEAGEVLALAEKEVDHAISLHEFTSLINDRLDMAQKKKIIELLWRVAFADAVLDKYEEYFIRKIADLLYVSHKDYIQAKHRASIED